MDKMEGNRKQNFLISQFDIDLLGGNKTLSHWIGHFAKKDLLLILPENPDAFGIILERQVPVGSLVFDYKKGASLKQQKFVIKCVINKN